MRSRYGSLGPILLMLGILLAIVGVVPKAESAGVFVDTTMTLPPPDGVVAGIRTFDFRADSATYFKGVAPGTVTAATFAKGIPVGTPVVAHYQSDVVVFFNSAGSTIPSSVGTAAYEITVNASLAGTVIASAPGFVALGIGAGSATAYLHAPTNHSITAGTGYQDGALILVASTPTGFASFAAIPGGSGTGSTNVDFGSLSFCNAAVFSNCSTLTDFHFEALLSTPILPPQSGTTAYFAVPPACTGGPFCFAPVPVVAGDGFLLNADGFGRLTGQVVPEPASLLLLGSGLMGLAGLARLRQRKTN